MRTMSTKTRLDKLEKLAGGDRCVHNSIYVWYGVDGSGEPREDEPPEDLKCWCGAPAVLLKVVYDSTPIQSIETQ